MRSYLKVFYTPALTMATILVIFAGGIRAAMLQCDEPPCDLRAGRQSGPCSPIIIDFGGKGFRLTSAQNGVRFDIAASGTPIQIAWTAKGAENAFLVLDRNGNGLIDNGSELFGNFTLQPPSPQPNGFAALAEFDKPEKGGNGDGIIDQKDVIFSSLRLWVDVNHDGIATLDELFRLPDLGVFSISLNYRESQRVDEYGNQFRFRARINVTDQREDESTAGPVAYDVFLTTLGAGTK